MVAVGRARRRRSACPALAGYAIGRLALKLRGAYFVLLTVSFAGVVSLVSVNWMELTNGPLGIPGVPALSLALPGLGETPLRGRAPTTTWCWRRPCSSY